LIAADSGPFATFYNFFTSNYIILQYYFFLLLHCTGRKKQFSAVVGGWAKQKKTFSPTTRRPDPSPHGHDNLELGGGGG
jgi:hypothetical protein